MKFGILPTITENIMLCLACSRIFVFLYIVQLSCSIELSHDPNDVHFYLYPFTDDKDINQEILFNETTSLVNSSMKPGLMTVFIVHGFRSNVSSEMPQEVKNAYLDSDRNYNYIVVSWGALSTPTPPELTASLYGLVVGNVPIVARRVTDFIDFLMNNNYVSLEKIHMIGHSLGSHISGLTGMYLQEQYKKNISRITGSSVQPHGLDPAGPLFFPPISCRNLMPRDADFVDVIHTNAGILGDTTTDGHADFWPNGGLSQPGCAANDTNGGIGFTGVCSHRFAYKLYAASFKKDLYACNCSRLLDLFVLRICLFACPGEVLMGVNCPSTTNGELYIETSNPP